MKRLLESGFFRATGAISVEFPLKKEGLCLSGEERAKCEVNNE